MDELHKRVSEEQAKVLLQGYGQELLRRAELQELLSTGNTRFFGLLKQYRYLTVSLAWTTLT